MSASKEGCGSRLELHLFLRLATQQMPMMMMNITSASPSADPTPTKAVCHVFSLPVLDVGFEGKVANGVSVGMLIGVVCVDGAVVSVVASRVVASGWGAAALMPVSPAVGNGPDTVGRTAVDVTCK